MNTALVNAYRRSVMPSRRGDGMSKAMGQIAETAGSILENEAARRKGLNDAYAENADKIIESGGSLGENFYEPMYDAISGMQEEYDQAVKSNDKKAQADLKMKMGQKKAYVDSFKDTWTSLGEWNNSKIKSNSSTPDQDFIRAYATSPDNKPVLTDDGYVWKDVEMPNGEVKDITTKDLENSIPYKATEEIKAIKDLGVGYLSQGAYQMNFSEDKAKSQMKDIINVGNMRSLMFDENGVSQRSFVDDLRGQVLTKENVINMFSGLTNDDIKAEGGEKNWYDNISEEDLKQLEDAITDPNNDFFDEERSKDILSDYYTKILKSQYDEGFSSTAKSSVEDRYAGVSALDLINKYS
jgi:hypothetical protein